MSNGLEMKNYFDANENKSFVGICDSSKAEPTQVPVKICVGYAIEDLPDPHRPMKKMQEEFNSIAHFAVVENVNEFKQAVIDGYIKAENYRLQKIKIIEENTDITEYKNSLNGKKMHEVVHPPEIQKKMKKWGELQKYKRFYEKRKPNLYIFLQRSEHDRFYIMLGNGNRSWSGFNFSTIDYDKLYEYVLKTNQHCKDIEDLINGVCDSLKNDFIAKENQQMSY